MYIIAATVFALIGVNICLLLSDIKAQMVYRNKLHQEQNEIIEREFSKRSSEALLNKLDEIANKFL